jgi:hypothetical protein
MANRDISNLSDASLFDAGERLGPVAGDPAREAIASLRGYTYQLYASALAWLRLSDGETLHLEVAEDYAVAAAGALEGAQVRDTPSRTITIRSVAKTIDALVDLVARNSGRAVSLRYLTTSAIGIERALADRIGDGPALDYWRRAAQGAPIAPLRAVLLQLALKPATIDFINARDDAQLRDALVRPIHWDAGQAPLEELSKALEAGLIEFATGTLRLSADIGRSMADLALAAVLKVTVRESDRRLRRADLITLGEKIGRVSVPRRVLEAMITGAPQRDRLLMPGDIVPTGAPVAERRDQIALVEDLMTGHGLAVVTGSTGMGKTHIAIAATEARGDWAIADLRGIDAEIAAARLNAILGEAVVSSASSILLDDLDCLDDPRIARAVRRLLMLLRRRDGAIVVTCANPPTRRTLQDICGAPDGTITVPYLTIEEVADLVEQAGGDRKLDRIIHLAGSDGHPQLVQAAILHVRSAGWARGAARDLFGDHAEDIAEEKRAARDRLVAAMPAGARSMLFRTSLIFGRFTRELALNLAAVDPSIAEPGVEIDRLVGPWIERPAKTSLRVSPLVANAGKEALSPQECQSVHRTVAEHLLRDGTISVSDSDALLYPARASGDEHHMMACVHLLLTADGDTLRLLAQYSAAIPHLPTDVAIYPANSFISFALRLGQLLVVLSGDDRDRALDVWAAIRREMADQSETFEVMLLSKTLITTPVSRFIPEWLDLVIRFDALNQTNPKLLEIAETIRDLPRHHGGDAPAFAFVYQATNLRSTAALRAAFGQIDTLTPDVRTRLFAGFDGGAGNYGHLVDSAWIKSAKLEGFDGEQAADDYLAMADLAERWGNKLLAARCHATRSVMLQDYVKDPDRALAAIDLAEQRLGPMTALSRARAKVQWQLHDHANALRGLAQVWHNTASDSDAIERGFIAREAGISAAHTGDWAAARVWFERSRACLEPYSSGSIPALKIGLLADAAQAAFESGDGAGAVQRFAQALEELDGLDEAASINNAYCHRVVRHGVLALMRDARPDPSDLGLADLPPGACSNPEPNEGIRNTPLGPIDVLWYMLANAALDLGDIAFFDSLYERLEAGPILGLEVARHRNAACSVVARADPIGLLAALEPYAAGFVYLEAERDVLLAGDMLNPTRATFPRYPLDGTEPDNARSAAVDLLVSFGMRRAMAGDSKSLKALRVGMAGDERASIRGLARLMICGEGSLSTLADYVASSIAEVASAEGYPVDPDTVFRATVRFAIWIAKSSFGAQLKAPFGEWMKAAWQQILDQHRFRLRSPGITAGPIAEALAASVDPLSRAARLALVAEAAVASPPSENVRQALKTLADVETA